MAMQFGSGTQQKRGDTRWVLLEKILIATNNIVGGGVFQGNYGGGQPPFTPTTGAATAYDNSNGHQWAFYGGAWH